MFSKTAAFLATLALASQAAAHGYVRTWTLDGVDYNGYSRSDGSPKPDTIGWSFTTGDEGPEMDLSSPNFICRQGAKPATSSGQITAGGQVGFHWTSDDKQINPDGWAAGHRGPIMTYIAPCNGECSSIDMSSLRWTKIAEQGVTGPANTQGTWATDDMRSNGGVATATIPSTIAPGNYVLRNEIIALHRAHLSEPEFYMQCGSIEVTGSGTDDLSGSGVAASQLYSTSDSQFFGFSVYDNRGDGSEWIVPGPALYSGAGSSSSGPATNGTATGTGSSPNSPVGTGSPTSPPTSGTDAIPPFATSAAAEPAPPQADPSTDGSGSADGSSGNGYRGPWGGRPRGSWRHI